MRVCFILPHPAVGPTGGYKVVYEYANRLVRDGFKVDVVYSGSIFWRQKPLKYKLSNCFRYIEHLIKGYSCRSWFALDKRVSERLTLSMNFRHMPKADIYVATSPYTAWYLNDYPVSKDRKFYLIQGKEDWGPGLKSILKKTYHFDLCKIVVSGWLKRMLISEYGEESILIPNGLDFTSFSLVIDPKDRCPCTVSMLYHTQKLKRCEDTFKALKIVKEMCPNLRVTVFGIPERPQNLPEWYDYFQKPDVATHNRINNVAAIYVASSETEGWGLTVGEAMICGQAVCCTDNDGYKEMAIDGETALLSPVRDYRALANNVLRLIRDDGFRQRLAHSGHDFVRRFSWDNSYNQLKQLFENERV